MAIVNCKECNKEVSDKAQLCPHCGVDRPSGKFSDIEKVICGIIIALMLYTAFWDS